MKIEFTKFNKISRLSRDCVITENFDTMNTIFIMFKDGDIINEIPNSVAFVGETEDGEINRLRLKQMKNAAAMLLVSQGTPMLLAGDEMANTQWGNNNAYCQYR